VVIPLGQISNFENILSRTFEKNEDKYGHKHPPQHNKTCLKFHETDNQNESG
jgi:hypothetical protein